jgi:hypothetical protein
MIIPDISVDEYVTGEKFEAFCDVDCEKDQKWDNTIRDSKEKVLSVFCQTHELKNKVPILIKFKDKKFVMVTHNSDGTIGYNKSDRWFDYHWKNEENIACWFSQNVEVRESNVIPIPIAVENEYIFKPAVKQEFMFELNRSNIKKEFKMFICYNVGTNPEKRKPPIEKFKGQSWVKTQDGFNNIELVRPYFKSMSQCQFVLAPDGNGIDTIRIWEALYMGCVPIVNRHVFTEYFAKHLPIIIVDDYNEITPHMLRRKTLDFEKRKFNYDLLKMSYWKNNITYAKNNVG